jgi:hypothetical protein
VVRGRRPRRCVGGGQDRDRRPEVCPPQIVVPILNIYRKYCGPRVSLYLLVTFYATMVIAGLVVETLFRTSSWSPTSATRSSSRRA